MTMAHNVMQPTMNGSKNWAAMMLPKHTTATSARIIAVRTLSVCGIGFTVPICVVAVLEVVYAGMG